jgi:hypothetical protein
MRFGQTVNAFYGSTVLFDRGDWDISKTREFGYHFGLEDAQQSLHRIEATGGYLYEVLLTFRNPIVMDDALRWDLRAIALALGIDPTRVTPSPWVKAPHSWRICRTRSLA